MTRTLRLLLTVGALLLTTHPLPAPIFEIPDKATPPPAPAKKANPTPKPADKFPAKAITREPVPKPAPQPAKSSNRSRFAGTWSGVVSVPGVGNIPGTWVINAAENSVTGSSPGYPTTTCAATVNGKTISWFYRADPFGIFWSSTSLTLIGDGRTALVTAANNWGKGSPSEVKRKN